ncbi:hypothetical protein V7152_24575 [Neobacillus drentensis]|uniref:hypothetical protein n=1 Tax=Neobacillus drentensis TaxID=220684 RepID=UPI002FFF320C
MTLINRHDFFKKYNVDQTEFDHSGLQWDQLEIIYNDYLTQIPTLITTASTISELLRSNPDAHSVRSRIKNPEHLIHKIIRKTIRERQKQGNEEYLITLENYNSEITDLIGIRVLHLYKDQALNIDQMIRDKWDLKETATIYIRSGDLKDPVLEDSKDFIFKEHPAAYRSWHYLIKTNVTKNDTIVEIQVRTIFEEGWSEVDHQLRYPLELDNQLLNDQLLVLNRLAGNADEMVNTIRETKRNLTELNREKEEQANLISELKKEIEELYKDKNIKEEKMFSFQEKIKKLEESQQRTYIDAKWLSTNSVLVDSNPTYSITLAGPTDIKYINKSSHPTENILNANLSYKTAYNFITESKNKTNE